MSNIGREAFFKIATSDYDERPMNIWRKGVIISEDETRVILEIFEPFAKDGKILKAFEKSEIVVFKENQIPVIYNNELLHFNKKDWDNLRRFQHDITG
jgi:hypothetical protein